MTTLYRYYDISTEDKVHIELERFLVIKETPCGYWYIPDWMKAWPEDAQQQDKRWVSKTARVRRCYPTKELAWQSYRARKYHQAMHHERARKRLEAILEMINDHPTAPTTTRSAPNPLSLISDGSILKRTI